jgi:hypothetical protein
MGMYANVCGQTIKINRELDAAVREVRNVADDDYISHDGTLCLSKAEVQAVAQCLYNRRCWNHLALLKQWLMESGEDELFFA